MAEQPDFIIDFQTKIKNLNDIKGKIADNLNNKKQFTDTLKTSLGSINDRLTVLAGLIKQLKASKNDLTKTIDSNTASIDTTSSKISELNDKIATLEQDKQNSETALNNQINALQSQITEKQSQIDTQEATLATLTQQSSTLKQESDALNNELSSKGTDAAAHAQQIQQTTDHFNQQLTDQAAECAKRIEVSKSKIEELEKQINEHASQMTNAQNICESKQLEINDKQQSLAEEGVMYQKKIDNLTETNNDLTEKLKQATEAIDEATTALNDLITNGEPNQESQQQINDALTKITENIEASIANINQEGDGSSSSSRLLSGLFSGSSQEENPQEENPQEEKSSSSTSINISPNLNIAKTNLFTEARAKTMGAKATKYINFLAQANIDSSDEVIKKAIQDNGLQFYKVGNNGAKLKGGRKTKKNRKNKKQKGGFTYKNKSDNRKILHTYTRKSRRKSSQNSSRRNSNSSQNSSSQNSSSQNSSRRRSSR